LRFRGRLLVARPQEPERPIHSTRWPIESGEFRASSARAHSFEPGGASPCRSLDADQRQALYLQRRTAFAGLVSGSSHIHESEPRVRPGDSWHHNRQVDRNHRYHPSGRSGARDFGDRTGPCADETSGIRNWFAKYLRWMTTSPRGKEERDAKNNHGTCWVMQVAEFARLTGNDALSNDCRDRFKTVLAPHQIAPDGRFPEELRRTKPYSYSLFNLDALSTVCQILSTPDDNLFKFELSDGRGMRKVLTFMYPFIANKKSWPHPPDVQYFEQFPLRQPSLLFAGLAYSQPDYLSLWKRLNPDPTVEEAIRNYPIRQPVLW